MRKRHQRHDQQPMGKSNLFLGRMPFGYRQMRFEGRRRLLNDPEESALIRRVFQLFTWDERTLKSITEILSVEHLKRAEARVRLSADGSGTTTLRLKSGKRRRSHP